MLGKPYIPDFDGLVRTIRHHADGLSPMRLKRLLPLEAVLLTQQRSRFMDPIILVISITAGLLQAAYWGTRLYRLYRIKKA